MHRGYVKLWRKTIDSCLIGNPNASCLFLYLLLKTEYKDRQCSVGGVVAKLHPGDVLFGRQQAAKDLKLSEKNVRTALKFLENNGIVASKPTNRFTVVSFINWESYQCENKHAGQQNGQQVANTWPTGGQQVATPKEYKNIRNNNNTPPIPPQGGNGEAEQDQTAPHPAAKKKRAPSPDTVAALEQDIDAYTDDPALRAALRDFRKMRERIRKPLTAAGLKLAMHKLDDLAGASGTPAKVQLVEQSILNSWQGIFPLKDNAPAVRSESGTSAMLVQSGGLESCRAPTVWQKMKQQENMTARALLEDFRREKAERQRKEAYDSEGKNFEDVINAQYRTVSES